MYTINSSSLIFRIIFVVPPHPGGFSRPAAAVGRRLTGRGEAELIQSTAGKDQKVEVITMFSCQF